jgi:hypothetical protein
VTPFHRALIAILPAWRPLAVRELPVWGFLLRRRPAPSRDEALRAEFRCALCTQQRTCRRRLARGRRRPAERCPNAELLRR